MKRISTFNKENFIPCIGIMMILLVVSLPLSSAQLIQPTNPQQFTQELEDTLASGGQEGIIGEDIVINVDQYQPRVIPTGVIEDTGATVYALLEGEMTNPSLTIPEIDRVIIRNQRVITTPKDRPVTVRGIRYHRPPPNELSLDNLGYLTISLGRIPREADVPDEIDIQADARIYFDVSSGLTFGPLQDVLPEQSYEEFLGDRDNHRFYAGFIQAAEVTQDSTTFRIFDRNMDELTRPISLKKGERSSAIKASRSGYAPFGRVFDRFTVTLGDIRSLSNQAKFLITKDGEPLYVTVSKGDLLYPGSTWRLEDIVVKDITKAEVKIRNTRTKDLLQFISDIFKGEVSLKASKTVPMTGVGMPSPTAFSTYGSGVDPDIKPLYDDFEAITDGDYTGIIEKIRAKMSGPIKPNEQQRINLENLVRQIRMKYLGHLASLANQLDEHPDDTAIISTYQGVQNILASLDTMFVLVTPTVSEPGKEKDPLMAYRKAIASYNEVLASYPEVEDPADNQLLGVKAMERIARLKWTHPSIQELYNPQEAADIYERMIGRFGDRAYQVVPDIDRLITILRRSALALNSPIMTVKDGEGEITVQLVDATAVDPLNPPLAVIAFGGTERSYTTFDGFKLKDVNWQISSISDTTATIESHDGGKVRTSTLTMGVNKAIANFTTGETMDVILKKVDARYQAHITIAPAAEAAFTDSTFNLHLAIEKRPFGLPLFSESIDAEIAKTDELLGKLDTIVEKIRKIYDLWMKFCLATFASIVAWNWISGVSGGNEAIARKKVNEEFQQKYQQGELTRCSEKKLSYEQCIFEYENEYMQRMTQSNSVIDEIDDKQYKTAYPNLMEHHEESLKELYYVKRMHELNPSDELYAKRFLELDSRMNERAVIESAVADFITGNTYKPYAEVKDKVSVIVEGNPYFEQLKKEGASEQKVYEEHKQEILDAYKEAQLDSQLNAYFEKLGTSPTLTGYKDLIDSQRKARLGTSAGKQQVPLWKIKRDPGSKHYFALIDGRRVNIGSDLGKEFTDGTTIYTIETKISEVSHKPQFTTVESGRAKGRVEFMSVTALLYLQIRYSDSGRVEAVEVWEHSSPNSPLGSEFDHKLGLIDDEVRRFKAEGNSDVARKLGNGKDCVQSIEKKMKQNTFFRGDRAIVDCTDLGSYSLSTPAPKVSAACTDALSPFQCKLLFQACDPVICPASRCNWGGEWQVENVVQSGLIGSTFLCMPNFPVPTVPVCITGIMAGMQGFESLLEGYKQCLITAKVEGRSVGICDAIRSVRLCDLLWREVVGIFNIKEGVLGMLGRKIFGLEGGGEYSEFEQAFSNAGASMEYFTQDYAKNTFALYGGGSLPELGATICKSAIFGKAPGIGNFFDQVLKPESPPQFTAFFEEAPLTDVQRQLSMYRIFYHIYAGERQAISYTISLEALDENGQPYLPTLYIRRGARIPAGQLASENLDIADRPSGYNRICVDIASDLYGRQRECGFGKVTTSTFSNFLADQYTQSEMLKQIDTEEECMPSSGRLTTLSSQDVSMFGAGEQLPKAAVGSFSTGLLSTGIVRKCSYYDPDVGNDQDAWVPVGTCGKDDRERDLGTCWLYKPAAQELIKQTTPRANFSDNLEGISKKVIQEAEKRGSPIPGVVILTSAEIIGKFKQAKDLRQKGINDMTFEPILEAITLYDEITRSAFIDENDAAKALYLKGIAYEELAKAYLFIGPRLPPGTTVPIGPSLDCKLTQARWTDEHKNTVTKASISDGVRMLVVGKNCADGVQLPRIIVEAVGGGTFRQDVWSVAPFDKGVSSTLHQVHGASGGQKIVFTAIVTPELNLTSGALDVGTYIFGMGVP